MAILRGGSSAPLTPARGAAGGKPRRRPLLAEARRSSAPRALPLPAAHAERLLLVAGGRARAAAAEAPHAFIAGCVRPWGPGSRVICDQALGNSWGLSVEQTVQWAAVAGGTRAARGKDADFNIEQNAVWYRMHATRPSDRMWRAICGRSHLAARPLAASDAWGLQVSTRRVFCWSRCLFESRPLGKGRLTAIHLQVSWQARHGDGCGDQLARMTPGAGGSRTPCQHIASL